LGKTAIRVLAVDDYKPWCDFVSGMVQEKSELKIVAEASNGLEAVQKAEELQPDLILLDVGLPILNGIEAAVQIRRVCPTSKILFLSADNSADIVAEALSTGASGYVLKADARGELLAAVEAVLNGQQFVSPRLSGPQSVGRGTQDPADRLQAEINPHALLHSASILPFLAKIIEATKADFGNVQLFDSTTRELRIVAHQGFESEFLDYFAAVSCDHGCACSAAMINRCRMVISDVAADPLLSSDSRGVLLRAKVRSVQSTPLIGSTGRFLGTVSTHYRRPGGVLPHLLKQLDDLADQFVATIDSTT
jgi:DNA-binding NarL/FixJ family response regulator